MVSRMSLRRLFTYGLNDSVELNRHHDVRTCHDCFFFISYLKLPQSNLDYIKFWEQLLYERVLLICKKCYGM